MPGPIDALRRASSMSAGRPVMDNHPYGTGPGEIMGAVPPPSGGAMSGLRKAGEALGEMLPEFTPVGAEDFYNVGKAGLGAVKRLAPGLDDLVGKYLSKIGSM